MTTKEKHHRLENDFRYNNLKTLFLKYDEVIDENKKNCYYDLYWDETYLIYGIILISLQNYINQNCRDFLDSNMFKKNDKSSYYKIHSKEIKNGVTQIELINHLANYFKHSDDYNYLHIYTFACLKDVGLIEINDTKEIELKKRKEQRFEYDILIEGINMIVPLENSMTNLLDITKLWREEVWRQYYTEKE